MQLSDSVDPAHVVAFVFSPLQALNLVEYIQRFGRQVDLVVVGHASVIEPSSRKQIEAVLSSISPGEILYDEWLLSPTRPAGALRKVAAAATQLQEHLSTGPYEFVVGEYRSAFSWAVLQRLSGLVQRLVVVDDGTATLRIDRRNSVLKSPKVRRQKLKALLFLGMGIRGVVPAAGLTFFTSYCLDDRVAEGDVIVRNDYRVLSAELRALPPDDECVYVIGGPHLEVGEVNHGDVELALELTRFATEFTGKQVVYMAHRRERGEKLDALRKEVTVVTPNVPFEIYPRVIGKRPRTIVGYYSSLFVTAAELLGDTVDIIALQIPRDRINGSWLPFIDDIYQYYRTDLSAAVRIVEHPSSGPERRA